MYDYKFRVDANRMVRNSRRMPLLPLALVPALVLGASGAYSVMAARENSPPEPVMARSQPSRLTVSLPLPGHPPTTQPSEALAVPATADAKPPQSVTKAPVFIEAPLLDTPSPAATPATATSTTEVATSQTQPTATQPAKLRWVEHTIRSGETLSSIFSRRELSAATLHRILSTGKEAKRLARVKPGQRLRFGLDADGQLVELTYRIDPTRSLRALRDGDDFVTEFRERPAEIRATHTSGTITNSLFTAAQDAGLSDALTMELANLFGWDIDFALDIRQGDRFTLIYEERFLDGDKLGDGAILAAEFVNQGQAFRALRYVDDQGHASYYTPDGKSVKKAFLRSPVEFTRISSRFSSGRKHPVLNRIRAHKGVDYAAPRGTPVRAAGDGKITLRGRKGGYGKTVVIEHGGGISTLYAHLSRYAGKGRGKRVSQGQIIGYVGSSGLATGPHLHYEFRLNGAHRNPLKVKLPEAAPIPARYREDFESQSGPLLSQLDLVTHTLVATAE